MSNSIEVSKLSFSMARLSRAILAPNRIQATAVRVATVAIVLLASAFVDGFANLHNLSSILFLTVSIGLVACGLALVTISGNLFMLSISATTSVATIVFAGLLDHGITYALIATLAAGGLCGVVQGVAVGVLKTNPIITTIASASIITGIGSWVSGGRTITSDVSVQWLGVGHLMPGIPNQVLILVLVLVCFEFFLSRMRLGRELKLHGVNPKTASLSGLRIGLAITVAYALAALTAALSGVLIAAQASQGNLSLGAGLDFSAIAAVLVGGIAITGGHGRIYDAVSGALFLAIVGNVLLLQGFSLDIQLMVKGAVVILSVLLGALLTRGRRV